MFYFSLLLSTYCFFLAIRNKIHIFELPSDILLVYIYLINQARGPYWENIGPIEVLTVNKRSRADILPIRSRASLVNKGFITRLKTIVQNILFRKKKKKRCVRNVQEKNDPISTEGL